MPNSPGKDFQDCWIEAMTVHIIVLFLVLEEAFSFPLFNMMLALGLSYVAFIMLKYIHSITNFLRVFILQRCWILLNAFSTSTEKIMWFLSFILFMWYITFIDLCILNYPCMLGINPTCSWYVLLYLFTSVLLQVFTSMFIRKFDV